MGVEDAGVVAVYERYLARCNEHRFDQLGEFVAEQVSGSGATDGLAAYIDRLEDFRAAFPDYRWELQNRRTPGPSPASPPPGGRSAPRSWSGTGSPTARSSSAGETSSPWSATP